MSYQCYLLLFTPFVLQEVHVLSMLFVIIFSNCFAGGSCLINVICYYLCIVVSNTISISYHVRETCATSQAETAYHARGPAFTLGFLWGSCGSILCCSVVFCKSLFVFVCFLLGNYFVCPSIYGFLNNCFLFCFWFDNCIVCPSSIYAFLLPFGIFKLLFPLSSTNMTPRGWIWKVLIRPIINMN